MPVLVPATYEALVANPVGKYAVGPCWIYAYFDDTLSAIITWGRLRGDALGELVRFGAVPAQRDAKAHLTLVDVRRVEEVESSAFAATAGFLGQHGAALGAALARLAIVEGDAMPAVVARGFFQVIEPPFDIAVFRAVDDALQWLRCDRAAEIAAYLDTLYADVTSTGAIVRDLRTQLAGMLVDGSLATAAQRLGISTRTLQRRLLDAGTTFQAVLDDVRITVAKQRLAETDDLVDEIARDLGFASSNHLAALFHRALGMPPSEWRKHARRS